jgi:hypothetical protein
MLCPFIPTLIFTLPLAGDAHGKPTRLSLRQGEEGLAIGILQDRLHHQAALRAHAQYAHA